MNSIEIFRSEDKWVARHQTYALCVQGDSEREALIAMIDHIVDRIVGAEELGLDRVDLLVKR